MRDQLLEHLGVAEHGRHKFAKNTRHTDEQRSKKGRDVSTRLCVERTAAEVMTHCTGESTLSLAEFGFNGVITCAVWQQ